MTAMQMNAELFRQLSIIAEDESLMAKLVKYAKKLTAKKDDPTLMTEKDFFARVDNAERQIAEGKGIQFTNLDDMNQWLETA